MRQENKKYIYPFFISLIKADVSIISIIYTVEYVTSEYYIPKIILIIYEFHYQ